MTIYERSDWIGGHSHTVLVDHEPKGIAVDTGFIVYNEATYPNLTALFRHLDVPTKPAPMSFSVSADSGRFEYASTDLNALFGQRVNLLKPSFWAMVRDIVRFYREAAAATEAPAWRDRTLGDFLTSGGYGAALADLHVLPMCGAIWSAPAIDVRQMPFFAFARFFQNHGLFDLRRRPHWRTVDGGSAVYVRRMKQSIGRVCAATQVTSVVRRPMDVLVRTTDGGEALFDDVVIAAHADEALALLADPSRDEAKVLGSFRYSDNIAVLHNDARLMPKRRRVWSSWNVLEEGDRSARPCVTYWMNRLQTLDRSRPLFVTLNPTPNLRPGAVIGTYRYTHPVMDGAAYAAQRQLWNLQGRRRTWFCGSYFGHGFHEDGLQSGLAVAEAAGGVRRPWKVEAESGRIHVAARELEPAP